MIGLQASWGEEVVRTSLAARGAQLLALMALSFAVISPLAYYLSGAQGLAASAVAAGTCLVAGVGALTLASLFPGRNTVAVGVLAGGLVRMAVPLVVVLVVYTRGGMLVEAGMVYYMLAYYFIALIVETGMVLRQFPPRLSGPGHN